MFKKMYGKVEVPTIHTSILSMLYSKIYLGARSITQLWRRIKNFSVLLQLKYIMHYTQKILQ